MGDPWHGLSGGRSLHDWLVDSRYLKPTNSPSRNGTRKKGRLQKKNDHMFSGPTITHVAQRHGDSEGHYVAPAAAPGKRKTRRWMNERLLRDLAGPLDAASIGALYAPPPWGEKTERTVLERVTTVDFGLSKDISAWEPFRSVDMDVQSQMLSMRESRSGRRESGALAAWRSVERNAREALRRSADWTLLADLEDKLVEFEQGSPDREVAGGELLVDLETAYQRLLLHGLCQFHGLVATTIDEVTAVDGTSTIFVVAIHRRRQRSVQPHNDSPELVGSKPLRVTEFLGSGRHGPPALAA